MEMNNNSTPLIKKDSKRRIKVDYEGKMSLAERLKEKFKASNTWIKFIVVLFRFILMLGVSFVIIYPFIARIAGSFMSKEDIIDATISLIPKHPTLEIYRAIIVENQYFEAMFNTLILALGCAVIQMLVACLVGYGLAKFKFKGNKFVMLLVIITMVIPHGALQLSILRHFTDFDFATVQAWGYTGIIKLLRGGIKLNLSNTFAPLFILSLFGLAFKNGLYIYLLRQFFKGVPDELEESAYVDGSGTFRTFFQIIMPLSIPMLITVFLFAFSWQWTDEFYTGLFFTSTINKVYLMPDVYQVPNSLNVTYAGEVLYKNVVQNTGGLLIIAPLIIVYLFGQKYLVQGIERSGLVG